MRVFLENIVRKFNDTAQGAAHQLSLLEIKILLSSCIATLNTIFGFVSIEKRLEFIQNP